MCFPGNIPLILATHDANTQRNPLSGALKPVCPAHHPTHTLYLIPCTLYPLASNAENVTFDTFLVLSCTLDPTHCGNARAPSHAGAQWLWRTLSSLKPRGSCAAGAPVHPQPVPLRHDPGPDQAHAPPRPHGRRLQSIQAQAISKQHGQCHHSGGGHAQEHARAAAAAAASRQVRGVGAPHPAAGRGRAGGGGVRRRAHQRRGVHAVLAGVPDLHAGTGLSPPRLWRLRAR